MADSQDKQKEQADTNGPECVDSYEVEYYVFVVQEFLTMYPSFWLIMKVKIRQANTRQVKSRRVQDRRDDTSRDKTRLDKTPRDRNLRDKTR